MLDPASVDLTLGSTFRVFRKVHEVIEVRDHTDYRECTDKLEIPDGGHILIMPGETVLGITRERVRLGPGLCGWLEGRSRFARLGLMVHISAPFMGPGIDSQQVLEMSNFGPAPLAVVPGTLICQFIFAMDGEEHYAGRFAGQSQSSFRGSPSSSRLPPLRGIMKLNVGIKPLILCTAAGLNNSSEMYPLQCLRSDSF